MNDQRQDGGKARNLVPYLQQLIIRQQVGGNADVFKSKGQSKSGPPSYVNPRKLQKLNAAVANQLKSMGHQGGVSDLSNMFYTEALVDWISWMQIPRSSGIVRLVMTRAGSTSTHKT